MFHRILGVLGLNQQVGRRSGSPARSRSLRLERLEDRSLMAAAAINNGGLVAAGQSLWVEYTSPTHTVGSSSVLTLSVTDASAAGTTTATDSVVFHSFQSVVIALGGNSQDPSKFGDPNLGTFT